jgi:hypothetical protein
VAGDVFQFQFEEMSLYMTVSCEQSCHMAQLDSSGSCLVSVVPYVSGGFLNEATCGLSGCPLFIQSMMAQLAALSRLLQAGSRLNECSNAALSLC